MGASYVIVGAETEKIYGIASSHEGMSEKDMERRKQAVCASITAGLIEIERVEELAWRPMEEVLEAVS